jgi:hypothetical protein
VATCQGFSVEIMVIVSNIWVRVGVEIIVILEGGVKRWGGFSGGIRR